MGQAFTKQAAALGIRFNGIQKTRPVRRGGMPLFTDSKTGSTFNCKVGETVWEAVCRHRAEWISKGGKFMEGSNG
jgi:hypothetical protein